jgi:hypothetical protein
MTRADSVSGFGYQPKGPLGVTTGAAQAFTRSSAPWTARHPPRVLVEVVGNERLYLDAITGAVLASVTAPINECRRETQ